MLRRDVIRGLVAVLLVLNAVLLGGCREEGNLVAATPSNTAYAASSVGNFGEFIYGLVHDGLASEPVKQSALEARHTDFVSAVNRTIPEHQVGQIHAIMPSMLGMIRNGTMTHMAGGIDGIIRLLLNDPADPQKRTLQALVELGDARGTSNTTDTTELLERMLNTPEVESFFYALADVIRQNDGVDDTGIPNGERDLVSEVLGMASRQLQNLTPGSQPSLLTGTTVVDALLSPCPLNGRSNVGDPAYAVHLDDNGNPRVKTDPATGALYLPFYDGNGDGMADVDANKEPIDRAGQLIDLPAFDTPLAVTGTISRDQYGRAVAPDGRVMFDYFDAKHTALGMVMLMAGDLIRRDVPHDLIFTLSTVMDRQTHTNGTADPSDDYQTLRADSAVIDLAWAGLELFKHTQADQILRSLAQLLSHDPVKSQDLYRALGRVLAIIQNSNFQQPPGGMITLLNDLVPLLDDVFEQRGQSVSSARLLFSAFRDKISALRNLPSTFADLMRYSNYRNRTPVGPGMKSTMEQILDLMYEANQCNKWPFGNMAEFYLDAMAGNESILGIKIQPKFINMILQVSWLRSFLCSQMSSNVQALQDFLDSGAMDAFIPIVEVFSDRGETALLKDIMLTLRSHYPTLVRPMEPTVADILASGAVEHFFDALNVMNTLRAPVTGENVANIVADFIAVLVDDDRVVLDRNGQRVASMVHMLVLPLEGLNSAAAARGADVFMSRAMSNIMDIAFAEDSRGRLVNSCLVDLLAVVLDEMANDMPSAAAARIQHVTDQQRELVSLLTGRDFLAVLDFAIMIDTSPGRQGFYDAINAILSTTTNSSQDVFGSLMKLIAGALQTKVDQAATTQVLWFLGRAIDPARGFIQPITRALNQLLNAQNGAFLFQVLRNSLDSGPNGVDKRPLDLLLEVFDDISAAGQPRGPMTVPMLESDLNDILSFLNDQTDGLPFILRKLGYRGP